MRAYLLKYPDNLEKFKNLNMPVLTRVRIASSFFEKLTGFIFKKEPASNEGLLFEDCSSIHTFWMRFPLDIVFLDSNNRILRIFSDLKPFRFTPLVKNSKKVLELKAGLSVELGLEAGYYLKFRE